MVFYHPGATSPQPGHQDSKPRPASDPYVGKITLPPGPDGAQVEFFIRQSDLSSETDRLRQKYLDRADEAIRKALQGLDESPAP